MLFGPSALVASQQLDMTSPFLSTPAAVVRSVSDLFPNGYDTGLDAITIPWRSGFDTRPIPPIPAALSTVSLPIEIDTQIGNTCGPTALSMTLLALGFQGASPQALTSQSDYHTWLGTSPQSMAATARSFGAEAVVLNESSLKEICTLLDKKIYCIALLQSGDGLHYVAIHGYQIEADKSLSLEVADPNGCNYFRSAADFLSEWNTPTVKNFPTGINRMIIAVSEDANLPAERFGGWCRVGAEAHSLLNRSIKLITEGIPQACSTLFSCCALPLIGLLGSSTASELWNLLATTSHLLKSLRGRLIGFISKRKRKVAAAPEQLFSSPQGSVTLTQHAEPLRKYRSSSPRYVRPNSSPLRHRTCTQAKSNLMVDDRSVGAFGDSRGTRPQDDKALITRRAA